MKNEFKENQYLCNCGQRFNHHVERNLHFAGGQCPVEKLRRVVKAGNIMSSMISALLENEDIECRGDEDCDHCCVISAQGAWDKINKGPEPESKDTK